MEAGDLVARVLSQGCHDSGGNEGDALLEPSVPVHFALVEELHATEVELSSGLVVETCLADAPRHHPEIKRMRILALHSISIRVHKKTQSHLNDRLLFDDSCLFELSIVRQVPITFLV